MQAEMSASDTRRNFPCLMRCLYCSSFAAGLFSVVFNIQFAVGIDPNQEKDNPVRSVSLKRRFVKSKSYGKYFNESTIKNRTKTLSKNIASKRESYLIRKYRKVELLCILEMSFNSD